MRFFSSSSRLSRSGRAGGGQAWGGRGARGPPPLTFIHAVQNGFQHLVAVAIAVFLPDGAIFTAEDDELSIAPAQGGEVRDLHDDGPAERPRSSSSSLITITTRRTDPRNCMLEGPREMIRLASPSPSTSGGGVVSFCGLTRRQVMRVGAVQVRGGMMIRRP